MKSILSRFIPLMALAAAIALAVAACGGNDGEKRATETAPAATAPVTSAPTLRFDTPAPTAEEAVSGGNNDEERTEQPATAATATESGTPALHATPAPTVGETIPGEIETAARKLLAEEMEVDAEDFKLISSEGMGWSDASLGCPQEGMLYAQVLTSGYKLVFDLEGASHAVHTNSDGSHLVVCGDGR